MTSIANMDYYGNNYTRSEGFRLFKRDPRISFAGRIHERLQYSENGTAAYHNALSEIMLMHTGYTAQAYEETGKLERNEKLLLRDLESDPNDKRAYSHLGDIYELKNDYAKALDCYKRALELSGSVENGGVNNKHYYHIIQNMIALHYSEQEILQAYNEAAASCSDVMDFDLAVGEYYRLIPDYKRALEYFERALQKAETNQDRHFSMFITRIPGVYKLVMDIAVEISDWGRAIKYAACLLKTNKYDAQVLQTFTGVLLLHSGAGASELFALLLSIYDRNNPKDKLYLYKSAQLYGQMPLALELLELIFGLFTDEEKALL